VDASQQPGLMIGQIFLERATFSHRDDALTLPVNTAFQPNLVVVFEGGLAPGEKTAFVRIRAHTKSEDRPLYSFDVTMMALLSVTEGQENVPLKDYVRGAAPAMLYPFVREAVAGLTWRGRFGPVWLAPFNITTVLSAPAEETRIPQPSPKIQRPSKVGRKRPKARSTARG